MGDFVQGWKKPRFLRNFFQGFRFFRIFKGFLGFNVHNAKHIYIIYDRQVA